MVPQLYKDFLPARDAFWRLDDDLLGTVFNRRQRVGALRAFTALVRVVFGADDRYLNPRVALGFASLFPNSELHLIPRAGHYVQVDEPGRVAVSSPIRGRRRGDCPSTVDGRSLVSSAALQARLP